MNFSLNSIYSSVGETWGLFWLNLNYIYTFPIFSLYSLSCHNSMYLLTMLGYSWELILCYPFHSFFPWVWIWFAIWRFWLVNVFFHFRHKWFYHFFLGFSFVLFLFCWDFQKVYLCWHLTVFRWNFVVLLETLVRIYKYHGLVKSRWHRRFFFKQIWYFLKWLPTAVTDSDCRMNCHPNMPQRLAMVPNASPTYTSTPAQNSLNNHVQLMLWHWSLLTWFLTTY